MSQFIEAVYENGLLRPTNPLSGLVDGQHVWIAVEAAGAPATALNVAARESELIERLKAEGWIERVPAFSAPKGFRPRTIQGPPLSRTILDDRD